MVRSRVTGAVMDDDDGDHKEEKHELARGSYFRLPGRTLLEIMFVRLQQLMQEEFVHRMNAALEGTTGNEEGMIHFNNQADLSAKKIEQLFDLASKGVEKRAGTTLDELLKALSA